MAVAGGKRAGGRDKTGAADGEGDEILWHRVAETVKPLKPRRRRALHKPAPTPAASLDSKSSTVSPKVSAAALNASATQSSAKPALPALSPAVNAGLDKRTAQRLGRGQLTIDARLDLHGMTQDQAYARLASFIRLSVAASRRCVLVITGKGFKPTGEIGVLRQAVPRWLNEAGLRKHIVALRHAQPKDGGGGALYVLLKRDREAAPAGKDTPPPKRLTRRRALKGRDA